jgi:RHS repeat-associated protein
VTALVRPDRIGTANPVVTARFRYDPYGNVIRKDGTSDTPWRYAGGWFDRFPNSNPAVQAGLYKMGERYYDPKIGRWTQRDPIDQATSPTEGNGYMYAGADPVNNADPTGRATSACASVESCTWEVFPDAVSDAISWVTDRGVACARGSVIGAIRGSTVGVLAGCSYGLATGNTFLGSAWGIGETGWSYYRCWNTWQGAPGCGLDGTPTG